MLPYITMEKMVAVTKRPDDDKDKEGARQPNVQERRCKNGKGAQRRKTERAVLYDSLHLSTLIVKAMASKARERSLEACFYLYFLPRAYDTPCTQAHIWV